MDLVAWSSNDPEKRWRRTLPDGVITLGRKADQSAWDVPWDRQISGLHATLTWQDGKLLVRKEPKATNRIYFQGTPCDEFALGCGEQFSIGTTLFALEAETATTATDLPAPQMELTLTRQELHQLRFADADERIEVLSALPGMIRYSPCDAEFEERVLTAVLQGIPRADAAAVVCVQDDACGQDQVVVRREKSRAARAEGIRLSRRLIVKAIRRRRQSVLHSWTAGQAGGQADADASVAFTMAVDNTWALCAPLPDEPAPGWGLYVTGQLHQGIAGQARQDLQSGDLKFAELVADIFGALRQLRDLERRQATLERFFSRPVLAALAEKDIDKVLEPRQTEVTVLMCDLRGSCRIAEDPEHDLSSIWQCVSEALCIMTTNIIDKDGVIGDFQGDAAMGFWGWPLQSAAQVEHAARAALAIRRDFGRAAQQPGHPLHGFSCGIGIAHGPAVAGRLGTPDQFKVDVFGPVVNRAARLESLTKYFRAPILLDDATAAALEQARTGHWARCRRLARVQPYGMTRTVMVSELLPAAVEPGSLAERDRRDYEAALDAFLAGRWQDTRDLLKRLPADGARDVLQAFMDRHAGKPPDGWDGVMVLDSK
jgi:adenylate cyclase